MRLDVTITPSIRQRVSPELVLRGTDLRNIGLLLLGMLSVVALISPVRSFPITDEWAYVHSVDDLLHLSYRLEAAQATSIGHIAWGALFALLFGQSFTTLAVAGLVMGAGGTVLFYLLLRQLGMATRWALLGTLMLACNPIYLHLSYTFMTDVTFMVYVFAALLFYIRGARDSKQGWFWLGSIATALAYLTRQYGILLVPAVLIFLWWSSRWSWRSTMAVAGVPIATLIGYMAWERTQPIPIAVYYLSTLSANVGSLFDYWFDHAFRITWAVSITGLLLLPLLRLPRRPLRAVPLFLLLGLFLIKSWQQFGSMLPVSGNIIDNTGFLLDNYPARSIWVAPVWGALAIAGAGAFSLYIVWCGERVASWLLSRPWRAPAEERDPIAILYLFATMMSGAALIITPFVFDRYLLPVVPVLIIVSLPHNNGIVPVSGLRLRCAGVLVLLLFGLLAQRDFLEHSAVRWQGAQKLLAIGVPKEHIDAGFEWQGWYLFEEGVQQIRASGNLTHVPFPAELVLDSVYRLSDGPLDGYNVVQTLPYHSWLSGGETRYVYVLKRSPAGKQNP